MSVKTSTVDLSPADRRREVAAILTRGVQRLLRVARVGGIMHAQESLPERENGLELSGEMRRSLSERTRELGPRDDGDET